MKTFLQYFVLAVFVLIALPNLAQNKDTANKPGHSEHITKTLPKEISTYFDFLRSYSSTQEMRTDMDNLSTDRLKRLAKIMYEANEKDAVIVARNLEINSRLSDSLFILRNKFHQNVSVFPKPIYTRNIILDKIRNQISHIDYAIVSSDYLLRVTIRSIKVEKYPLGTMPPQSNVILSKIDVNAIVDDVLNGNSRFSIGDTITFYYFPFWRLTNWNFEIGESCLIPLTVAFGTGNFDWLALKFNLDTNSSDPGGDVRDSSASFGRYPIINGELIDRNNFWGLGKKVPWDTFHAKMMQHIDSIKTW